jgi:hypothetical protein
MSFNSYTTICTSNYGKPAELVDCLKPYYNQQNMDKIGIIAAVTVIFTTFLIFALQRLKLK